MLEVGFEGWARRQEPSEGIGHRIEDPIYLFPEMKLRDLPQSCICERFIYSHGRSTYFAAVWLERDWTMVFRRMVGVIDKNFNNCSVFFVSSAYSIPGSCYSCFFLPCSCLAIPLPLSLSSSIYHSLASSGYCWGPGKVGSLEDFQQL